MSETYALLFPGQGSQEPGMGRDLAEKDSDAMDLWKQAESISNLPLRAIYWEGDAQADAQAMADTRNLQPALTVVNLATYMHVHGRLSPMGAAGHSLGEFSALAAAKVLSLADTLELVSLRGRLMAESDAQGSGGMGAVLKLAQEQVEKIVAQVAEQDKGVILIANYNSPAQFVISGSREAVDGCAELVREAKGRLVPLAVSGAFHSPLMQEPAKEFEGVLRKKDFNTAAMPVYLNVTGMRESDPEAIRDGLCRQMTSSVRWIQTMDTMYEHGARRFLEIGPKNVLSRLVAPNLKDRDGEISAESVNSKSAMDAL